MKFKIILIILILFSINTYGQIELFDSSEELVPLRKNSTTIGKCCQLGKAMSKLTGGMTDMYLTQAEKNEDGSYTIFFVSGFEIGFDTELTQFGLDNPTGKISSFHLKDQEMFFKLKNLMINGYKEFKANPLVKKIKYADISSILDGGNNEGDKLLLRFHNKKIVKYVSFQVFDKETGYKTSSKAIFSKFIGQLFGSNEVIDID